MSKPLVAAIITTDLREDLRRYSEAAPSFGTAPTALLQGMAAMQDCEVHVVTCVQRPVASPARLTENTFYHSVEIGKWGWLRGGYAGCVMGVRRKLREIKPDIVHGQGTERYCALSAVFSGFPNVVTIHGNMRNVARVEHSPPFSFNWLAARLEAFTLPRTQGVVCLSNHTVKAVRDLAAKTWVVGNAVDASFFDVPRNPVSPKRVICAANISVLKNQKALIHALDDLAPRLPFELLFLGNPNSAGNYGREFLEMVRQRPWCRHHDFVGRAELKGYLAGASLLVLPSLEDNCPMVILEAMAAGVPVVASNVGGIPDLVETGATGILCDPRDPASIRSGVEKMLGDGEFARGIAERARAKALTRFHPHRVAQKHLEIYREVLGMRTEA